MSGTTEVSGVVETRAEAATLEMAPLMIVESLADYLDARSIGSGPVTVRRIGEGYSNVTFSVDRGVDHFVLRRGPRPPFPRSTHDMVREATIQQAVSAAGVPVPTIVDVCADEAVLGVPFYLMEFLDGEIVTSRTPDGFDVPAHRREVSAAAVDALVALHSVDVGAPAIAGLGRPVGYLERQVSRFRSMWPGDATRELPLVESVGAWLADRIPPSQRSSIVHGDYRIGNLMYERENPPRVKAILDWEMATLGDPLADLGYLTATYAEPGSPPTPMELTPVTREPGYLSRDEVVERYSSQLPLDLDVLPWYQVLALWKASIFCEAIYTRWLRGENPDDAEFGPSLTDGVPTLLSVAAGIARLPGGEH